MPSAADFEKLGVFYLGRPYDWQQRKGQDGVLLYDSKDLVTHAVCVGMTGSGKTGLCLALIEEAAIDGIPAILIDPKGDLGNLLLTFPALRPEDFRPWINEDDARRKNLSPDDYARQQAEQWRKGLAAWGQDGARIQRLCDAADFVIYTPGSQAGIPLSILKSFAAPPAAIREDEELLRERIGTTTTSLLGLLGIDADPIKSREHILIATLLDGAWRAGRELDLAGLIQQIQTPPVKRVGVLDLDAFFPAKDRFALAMSLNNLLAAPGFGAWMEGEPLDVDALLHTPEGKPRVAIVSIAHLNDAERMFFVSLLLNQVVGWMRTQSGTTSLRALLYMDEIFGYFPPVANPPSKTPLLTLLKQARAFGIGVVLATQNPVDLDYKGLANAGTWLIGRLQTERDKARVLDGLESAAGAGRPGFDRAALERILSGLSTRIFLMNNVHEDEPVVFETRWVMSYLRGPLTRAQIKSLMDARRGAAATPAGSPAATSPAPTASPGGPAAAAAVADPGATPARAARAAASPAPVAAPAAARPLLPPDVPQHFVPVAGAAPAGSTLHYRPMVIGSAQVRFVDSKSGADVSRDLVYLTPITDEAVPVAWDQASPVGFTTSDLAESPAGDAAFADLPAAAAKKKSYEGWSKDLVSWLLQSQRLDLLRSPSLKVVSRPDESERDFRVRLQESTRQQRDQAVESLRHKYASRMAALQERRRRAEQAVERESEQVKQQGLQTAISVGATILGAFLGRKTVNISTIGRATTAARGAGRVLKESQDVGRARESVAAVDAAIAALDAEFKAEADALGAGTDPLTERLETVSLKPTRPNISVRLVALAWAPCWRDRAGAISPAWK
ncbi:MAG TPA: ATP-binding protein [Methylomirabilota bacterium]|nr:ATP-binding protein [Methylomirabilota bacterium]